MIQDAYALYQRAENAESARDAALAEAARLREENERLQAWNSVNYADGVRVLIERVADEIQSTIYMDFYARPKLIAILTRALSDPPKGE